MPSKQKINIKLFLALSIPVIVAGGLFLQTPFEFFGYTVATLGTITSLYMLREMVFEMVVRSQEQGIFAKRKKSDIIVPALTKHLILVISMILGGFFMQKKIIIALLNYVALIFILVLSLKPQRTDT